MSGRALADAPQRSKSIRKVTTVADAVPVLTFPIDVVSPISHLSSLSDNRSTYSAVARSCLHVNQFAGSDHSLWHDATYVKIISTVLNAVTECSQCHEDRRCRILGTKTLAIITRSAYARLRYSPLLHNIRDGTLNRLEDELGTDVPVTLCMVALDDLDDGVSACAVEALGMLTISTASMVGTIVDDELLREVDSIMHARPSPFSPTLATLSDEDPSISLMELQSRVYENVLSPRLWRLVRRILHYDSTNHMMRVLPFLTACLVHMVKTSPSNTFGMDRVSYAKRWIEVDALGIVYDVVTSMLLPAMQQSNDGALAHSSTLSALRLANVCPHASWVGDVSRWAVVVLQEQLAAMEVLEHKMATIATLLVVLRALPLAERTSPLMVVANEVRFLPSTTMAPSGVTSPGLFIGGAYRRPARMGFLTELALSFLLDGPSDSSRADQLKIFFHSPEAVALLGARSVKKKQTRNWASNQSTASHGHDHSSGGTRAPGGPTPTEEFVATHVAEELVLAFCSVACEIGERYLACGALSRGLEEWISSSIVILTSLSSCVIWRSRTVDLHLANEDRDSRTLFSMLTACQASFIRLFHQIFYVTGMLSPSSSVSLHLLPLASPARILLLEDLALANSALARYTPIEGLGNFDKELLHLADQFLEYKFRDGVPSRHIRISLLSLLSDHWVQSISSIEEATIKNMNEMNARELLTMLSEEILALTDELNNSIGLGTSCLNYVDVCVAAVENIALTAADGARNKGGDVEDSKYIVSVAFAALEGRNLRVGDVLDGDQAHRPNQHMLSSCSEALKRIEDSIENAPTFSLLVTTAARDFHRRVSSQIQNGQHDLYFADVRSSPFVLTDDFIDAPLVIDDSAHHAFFTQYCKQVVNARTDVSVQAAPISALSPGVPDACLTLSRNWLRLTALPPPLNRIPKAGTSKSARVSTSGAVQTLSGGSDPVTFVLAYSVRRCPRYDCEPEYKLVVTMRVYNITAVEIPQGVRLDLNVMQQRSVFAVAGEEGSESHLLCSTQAIHKQEIKPGDHVTWEVAIDNWPPSGTIELHPSVVFREMEAEHSAPQMIKKEFSVARNEVEVVELKKFDEDSDGNDDTDLGTASGDGSLADDTVVDIDDDNMDIILWGEPVRLSPMVGMQPCPLVFFRDGCGDVNVFRFLWYQMPHRLPEMMLLPVVPRSIGVTKDDYASSVADSSVILIMEPIGTYGMSTKGWAFMTLSGNRLLCLLVEMGTTEAGGTTSMLYLRSDDETLLLSLMGSDTARRSVVAALTDYRWTSDTF